MRAQTIGNIRGLSRLTDPPCQRIHRSQNHPAATAATVHSTDYFVQLEDIRQAQAAGDTILYEYIDDTHPDLWGKPASANLLEYHSALLADDRVVCIATAEKLLASVRQMRTHNTALVTNGVDRRDFSTKRSSTPPASIASVLAKGRPLVGYHGALAKWFDYELIHHLCRSRPNIEVVLIGADIDGSLAGSGLTELPNLTFLGPVNYADLPYHSAWFDAAIIPFRLNALTESTSPIKLFEYMALGKPIVATDMPECRKYHSVLIGKSADAFIANIDQALTLRTDSDYLATLNGEAQANTWQAKARTIADLLRASLVER